MFGWTDTNVNTGLTDKKNSATLHTLTLKMEVASTSETPTTLPKTNGVFIPKLN
jgi:hypothetical protein